MNLINALFSKKKYAPNLVKRNLLLTVKVYGKAIMYYVASLTFVFHSSASDSFSIPKIVSELQGLKLEPVRRSNSVWNLIAFKELRVCAPAPTRDV